MAGVQEVLAERYELLDVLGRGGMGVVYRARDRVLQRVVAVKVLPLDRAQDPNSVARFEREALAVAGLSHRNIVAVFDSGTDGETRFIVMEYLPGRSLAELVQQRGAFGVEEAVAVVAQIAAALAAAHRTGIVHRDVKPANVMLDDHGHVKVLDFGIARLTAGSALTQTATVLGSAPYLAPELSRGARADARSDIYALGCVLYELLTGRPPFRGEVPAAVVHQHLSATPRRPEELNANVPARLSTLTLQMLAKEPDQRPQDAGQLAARLPATLLPATQAATGQAASTPPPRTLRPTPAGAGAGEAPTLPLASATEAVPEPTRVMPWRLGEVPIADDRWATKKRGIAAAALILALALALTLLALTSGSTPRATADHRAKHTVARKRTSTQTTPGTTTPATATRTVDQATGPARQGPPPKSKGPPDHGRGGPHGQPPGQAKKLGNQQGPNDQ